MTILHICILHFGVSYNVKFCYLSIKLTKTVCLHTPAPNYHGSGEHKTELYPKWQLMGLAYVNLWTCPVSFLILLYKLSFVRIFCLYYPCRCKGLPRQRVLLNFKFLSSKNLVSLFFSLFYLPLFYSLVYIKIL